MENLRIKSSVLADLGPLPEVVESNSDTAWALFAHLDTVDPKSGQASSSQYGASLQWPASCGNDDDSAGVDAVVALARRLNRICPVASDWLRLQAILTEFGEAPAAAQGPAFRRMPALAKRALLRQQVEWAAEHGCLPDVRAFLEALPEDRWTHMED